MPGPSIDTAEAIKDLLNAASVANTFAFQFTAVRAYVPKFVLEEDIPAGLNVYVSPTTHGIRKLTRGTNLHQLGIAVSVIKKPEDRSNESIDPLVDLVTDMKVLLIGAIDVNGQAANTTINEEPLYRPEQLIESAGLFWGAFTVVAALPRDPD